jgi:NAD(P)-dependent dehydrogenase (short-subunit alcohol dehydrogenase family)
MGVLDGRRVAVVGSRSALGVAAVSALEAEGALVAAADADAGGDATAGVEQAIATLGGVDVLLNLTAPEAPAKPSVEVGRTEWESIFKTTVRTARTSNQAAFRHMAAHGGGHIVNHADQSAEFGIPGYALACAAAQAVVALSNASANAWHGTGVRINVVQPGLASDRATSVVPTIVFLAAGGASLHGKTVPC